MIAFGRAEGRGSTVAVCRAAVSAQTTYVAHMIAAVSGGESTTQARPQSSYSVGSELRVRSSCDNHNATCYTHVTPCDGDRPGRYRCMESGEPACMCPLQAADQPTPVHVRSFGLPGARRADLSRWCWERMHGSTPCDCVRPRPAAPAGHPLNSSFLINSRCTACSVRLFVQIAKLLCARMRPAARPRLFLSRLCVGESQDKTRHILSRPTEAPAASAVLVPWLLRSQLKLQRPAGPINFPLFLLDFRCRRCCLPCLCADSLPRRRNNRTLACSPTNPTFIGWEFD